MEVIAIRIFAEGNLLKKEAVANSPFTVLHLCRLDEGSFRLFANRHDVVPRECAGLAITRWRRADLDALIDRLPARGSEMTPDSASPDDLAQAALARAARRARG